jgi:hypothetical protein
MVRVAHAATRGVVGLEVLIEVEPSFAHTVCGVVGARWRERVRRTLMLPLDKTISVGLTVLALVLFSSARQRAQAHDDKKPTHDAGL